MPAARLRVPRCTPTVLHSGGAEISNRSTVSTRNIVVPYISIRSPTPTAPGADRLGPGVDRAGDHRDADGEAGRGGRVVGHVAGDVVAPQRGRAARGRPAMSVHHGSYQVPCDGVVERDGLAGRMVVEHVGAGQPADQIGARHVQPPGASRCAGLVLGHPGDLRADRLTGQRRAASVDDGIAAHRRHLIRLDLGRRPGCRRRRGSPDAPARRARPSRTVHGPMPLTPTRDHGGVAGAARSSREIATNSVHHISAAISTHPGAGRSTSCSRVAEPSTRPHGRRGRPCCSTCRCRRR